MVSITSPRSPCPTEGIHAILPRPGQRCPLTQHRSAISTGSWDTHSTRAQFTMMKANSFLHRTVCVLNVFCTVRIVWFKQKTWSTVQNVQSVCCTTLHSSTLFLCKKKTYVLAGWKQNFSNWPMVFDHFLATHNRIVQVLQVSCSECRTPKWLVQVLLAWTGRSGESSTATKNMTTWTSHWTWKHEKWAKNGLKNSYRPIFHWAKSNWVGSHNLGKDNCNSTPSEFW